MLTTLLLLAALAPSAQAPNLHVRIDAPGSALRLADRLESEGFDVLEDVGPRLDVPTNAVDLVVSADEHATLLARGLAVTVIAKGRPLDEILAEREAIDGVPSGYLDLAGVMAEMNALAAAHPARAQLVDLTATYGAPATFGGRHLFALKISDNVAQTEDEPAVLIVSAHHCREIVTPVLALDAADRLLSGYAGNATIRAAVDEHEIWIAPVWNPDGYHHVFTADNLWRKNRRVFSGGIGVDTNRNYPQGWNTACSGSTSPSSSTYKGPSAGSEAETQTMLAWSMDRRFAKVLDYHSSGRETLWGYDCPTTPIDGFWQSQAIALSQASGYGGVRSPSADGEHYQWQFAHHGAMAYLTETALQFQPSYSSAVSEAATVWPGTQWLLARDVPLTGRVTDACGGAPIEATIRVTSLGFTEGEASESGGAFGRYHAFLPAGSHTLLFEAPGYAPETVTVQLGSTSTTVRDVALVPTGTTQTTFCSATPGSNGMVPDIYTLGSASISQNQFTLYVDRLPANQMTRFFMGQSFTQEPLFGGFICIDRPRFQIGLPMSDLFGISSLTLDLSQPPNPLATVTAGSSWGFQLAYRDPAAGGTMVNFSPALRVTFCP